MTERSPEPRTSSQAAVAIQTRLIESLIQALGADLDVVLHTTHISQILLIGEHAYKFKKPVSLGFLDFTTLAARERFCREELRLNRRTAASLYVDVVPVTGTVHHPTFAGTGEVLDYAVKMHRFDPEDQLDARCAAGTVTPSQIDRLADTIARFHATAHVSESTASDEAAEHAIGPALENFDVLGRWAAGRSAAEGAKVEGLRAWTRVEGRRLREAFGERAEAGMVREGHGDLHLANLVARAEDIVPFDCIEFDRSLRVIDVMSDAAFTQMDLLRVGHPRYANRFANRYLERTGDYQGLRVRRFYLVYRALVRAKVAALPGGAGDAVVNEHLRLAQQLRAAPRRPAMLFTVGLSGSGKSTVAQRICEATGAVRVRSDVERKRLHGLALEASSGSELGQQMYHPQVSRQVTDRLATLAAQVIASGHHVVVDATFLRAADRRRFTELAARHDAPVAAVHTYADPSVLGIRLDQRRGDASEATREVLAHQRSAFEPLTEAEQRHAFILDTTHGGCAEGFLAAVGAFLDGRADDA